ncbi:hypothetical protein [Catellatospora sp. NPDC049609]|uniref:hypothetical protein n=1 Tax=Catellatospora sp. NPDC049609 TaxID=3155505 RepID=UPI0034330C1F
MSEDGRWSLLHRAVTDTGIPIDVRAAASLLLVYGLPITFIAELTIDDITTHGGKVCLRVGEHRTQLPPAVASLIEQTIAAARAPSVIGRAVPGTRWLFPGRLPGWPIAAASLGQRLRRHGIMVRHSRTARLSLAEDLPAPVLSKLLGISVTAATRWTHNARRDWLSFVSARAATTSSSPTL